MNMKSSITMAVGIGLCAIAVCQPGICMAQKSMTHDEMALTVAAVAAMEGEAYVSGRQELEGLYKNNKHLFADITRDNPDWRVSLLGAIVRERVDKADQVKMFVSTPISYARHPKILDGSKAMIDVGHSLVVLGSNTPMVLVEKVWKTNDLSTWRLKECEGYYALCSAIGDLRIKVARPVLENILTNDMYFSNRVALIISRGSPESVMDLVRSSAAASLGKIGDPRSLPVLLMNFEKRIMGSFAAGSGNGDAMVKCLDKDGLALLEVKRESTTDKEIKDALTYYIKEYHKFAATNAAKSVEQ